MITDIAVFLASSLIIIGLFYGIVFAGKGKKLPYVLGLVGFAMPLFFGMLIIYFQWLGVDIFLNLMIVPLLFFLSTFLMGFGESVFLNSLIYGAIFMLIGYLFRRGQGSNARSLFFLVTGLFIALHIGLIVWMISVLPGFSD